MTEIVETAETVEVKNCLKFWKIAEDIDAPILRKTCLLFVEKNFKTVSASCDLKYVTLEMMKTILEDENLIVDNEVRIIEMMLKWTAILVEGSRPVHLAELLPFIRWSGIHVEYIKSCLLANSTLTTDPACFTFLSQVVSYQMSGIPFDGILTFFRPSTGQEKCVIVVGVDDDETISSEVHSVSLQRKNHVDPLTKLPTTIQMDSAVCVYNSMLYVSGVGNEFNEIWRYEVVSSWIRLANLTIGRCKHCMTLVGNHLYILGGYNSSSRSTLDSIEQYDILTYKCQPVGTLPHFVNGG